ncbi:cation:proton antiporter domain-containing protein [Tomitella biformata]|uniref:cation:proton antiporter domain-containing protein n=1 Tax=Tomitella biformata TaxID=630403 RepID=UPI000463BF9B|nr:cation:proton antiporter [Tomitella biformata]
MSNTHAVIQTAIPISLAAVTLGYALIARRLQSWNITAPMAFVAAGVVLGSGWFGDGELGIAPTDHWFMGIAEFSLAMLMFSDASKLSLREVEGDHRPVAKMLTLAFPLTLLAGLGVTMLLFPQYGWQAALLTALLLCPTDTTLAGTAVTDERVPSRVRRILGVEGGLYDGGSSPVLTLLIIMVAVDAGELSATGWIATAAWEVFGAVLVAVVVGGLGGLVLRLCRARGWTTHTSQQVAIALLAVLAYTVAIGIDANGYVSVFLGGLVFGTASRDLLHEDIDFAETAGTLTSFIVWLVFGAAMVIPAVTEAGVGTWILAGLALTVLRMGPVALVLARSGFRAPTIAYLGWFGPRGLATVIFAILALQDIGPDPITDHLIQVATITALLSIVAHGLTAGPLSRAYGRWAAQLPSDAPELAPVRHHQPLRKAVVLAEPEVGRENPRP